MTGGWGTPSWMGGEPVEGEVFVSEKTQDMARLLLEAAEQENEDPIVVRAVNGGFIVPEAVWVTAKQISGDRSGTSF